MYRSKRRSRSKSLTLLAHYPPLLPPLDPVPHSHPLPQIWAQIMNEQNRGCIFCLKTFGRNIDLKYHLIRVMRRGGDNKHQKDDPRWKCDNIQKLLTIPQYRKDPEEQKRKRLSCSSRYRKKFRDLIKRSANVEPNLDNPVHKILCILPMFSHCKDMEIG